MAEKENEKMRNLRQRPHLKSFSNLRFHLPFNISHDSLRWKNRHNNYYLISKQWRQMITQIDNRDKKYDKITNCEKNIPTEVRFTLQVFLIRKTSLSHKENEVVRPVSGKGKWFLLK